MGRILNAVVTAPVTSTVRGLSTEVALGPADGVRHPSVANLDQTQLVARSRLVRRVGRARPASELASIHVLSSATASGRAEDAPLEWAQLGA